MEQINEIVLRDPDVYPEDKILEDILGKSFPSYNKLMDLFKEYGLSSEWRYYRDGKAWLCKIQKKKKTIVWMSAWKGFMKATIYIHEKYIDGIYNLAISKAEVERIKNTNNVGKSKPCSFDIMNQKILPVIEKVMVYKIGLK